MSEMIERVARAISSLPLDARERPLDIARAALRAQLEPTEAMVNYAALNPSHRLLARAFWVAMVHFALGEKPR